MHTYEYDKLGRIIHDRVTTLGSGVDNAVMRLSTSYEVRGMVETQNSWNNASATSGDVVNQCEFAYNNFQQRTADYQEHGGAVNTTTTPKVKYGYADGSTNTIRATTMTYPNGRVLTYGYGTSGSIDDAASRIANLIVPTGNTVQQNAYDPRTFQTTRIDFTNGTLSETRHFYYTSDWQSVEERLGTNPDSAAPERQHAWGQRYVDELTIRDRSTNSEVSLNERLYGLQDANWNVVAMIGVTVTAEERYVYSAFGWPTFLNGSMSTIDSTSAIDASDLFTAQRFDSTSSLHLFRYRWFDSTTGRFITPAPLNYPDGPNSYTAWFAPLTTDTYGLKTTILFLCVCGTGMDPYPTRETACPDSNAEKCCLQACRNNFIPGRGWAKEWKIKLCNDDVDPYNKCFDKEPGPYSDCSGEALTAFRQCYAAAAYNGPELIPACVLHYAGEMRTFYNAFAKDIEDCILHTKS